MTGHVLSAKEIAELAALEATPGPWIVYYSGVGWVSAADGRTVLGVSYDRDGEGSVTCSVPDLELMAAAPNLLATSLDLQARLASHEEDARRRVDALAAAERALDEARASHILAVERGDASRAPPRWHFDGETWWRNDEPRRPIVLVRRRAGERRPASTWHRPGIDGDADGPEFATALEAMEAADAAQGDP